MKTRLIIMVVLAALAAGTARAQANLEEMTKRLEALAKEPSKGGAISMIWQEEKDKDGNVIVSKKYFVLTDMPHLIWELVEAFDKDRENASSVTETNSSGNNGEEDWGRALTRMYTFKIGDNAQTVFQLDAGEGVNNNGDTRKTFLFSRQHVSDVAMMRGRINAAKSGSYTECTGVSDVTDSIIRAVDSTLVGPIIRYACQPGVVPPEIINSGESVVISISSSEGEMTWSINKQ
jgi:hypothetical protein